ncbi:MAG: hypothetical protein ACFCBW_10655 [Candidatus Competibacterales bacterium]
MQLPITYQKTPQGQRELDERSGQLALEQRAVLIMVNGKRDTEQLAKTLSHFDDVQEHLMGLLEAGFIEPAPELPGSNAASTPDPQVATLKAPIAAAIERYMGFMAAPMKAKLETCRTPAAIRHHALHCRNLIAETLTTKKADKFWREVATHLDATGA